MFALLKKPVRSKPKPLETVKRTLAVGDRAMPLTIRENRRATRITLRIEPGGRALNLTVPAGLLTREIDDFLDRHQGWLLTKLAKFSADNQIRPGGRIAFRGVSHRIEHTGTLRGLTEAVMVDGEPVLRLSGLEDHMGRRLSTFFKKEARKDLEVLVARHAAAIRKPIKSVSMKDTRSRWGSCSWDGNLSFSWRIVMAPPLIIDYLAAHEVAHLKEMNHGPKFWALCKQLCPRMEEARKWLKQHGSQLHAIDFE
ncbi:M48 family metallopeptidase [Neorhizobium galegae]|uniref:M48 family metallopeptidase n=1 Tax=Neorhizobium galegae TaxID=399 RepID=UPI00062184AF|nr:M48 family metallopeptidase [Neorhizobium galegae]CDZ30023.1 Putative metal-dependent hydrolase [Neorhizobium galegae bv. officinalis]KAA9385303.1 M48 family metallopeptidase [Neorhizobium galegae]KAB1109753.1 M48 family metallopeptidase [Neorhizobium galegae]MCM2501860.1 M48 family metallopeptidase [Neorhizobium galegae]MCQ1771931.1 M48 family metallopeptidase [Neorhizobium galegae]